MELNPMKYPGLPLLGLSRSPQMPEQWLLQVSLSGLQQEQFHKGLFGIIKGWILPTMVRLISWLPMPEPWLLLGGRIIMVMEIVRLLNMTMDIDLYMDIFT